MVDYGDYGANSYCMLELARRGSGDTTPSDTESGLFQNRIGLAFQQTNNLLLSLFLSPVLFPVNLLH